MQAAESVQRAAQRGAVSSPRWRNSSAHGCWSVILMKNCGLKILERIPLYLSLVSSAFIYTEYTRFYGRITHALAASSNRFLKVLFFSYLFWNDIFCLFCFSLSPSLFSLHLSTQFLSLYVIINNYFFIRFKLYIVEWNLEQNYLNQISGTTLKVRVETRHLRVNIQQSF